MKKVALLVAVAAGSAEAFVPAPCGLVLRGSVHSGFAGPQSNVQSGPVRAANGVLAISANLKNMAKINQLVPRNWQEGKEYTKATKVSALSCGPSHFGLKRPKCAATPAAR